MVFTDAEEEDVRTPYVVRSFVRTTTHHPGSPLTEIDMRQRGALAGVGDP